MRILYLHGLDGFLSDDKRAALAKYGEVVGPQIDYRSSEQILNELIAEYQAGNIDVVIGNSLGGLAAYYISLANNIPCLIFNPALPYASVLQNIPDQLPQRRQYLQVVLGRQDDVVKAADNLVFLDNAIDNNLNAAVHILNHIGHRIPIKEFTDELHFFFRALGFDNV